MVPLLFSALVLLAQTPSPPDSPPPAAAAPHVVWEFQVQDMRTSQVKTFTSDRKIAFKLGHYKCSADPTVLDANASVATLALYVTCDLGKPATSFTVSSTPCATVSNPAMRAAWNGMLRVGASGTHSMSVRCMM